MAQTTSRLTIELISLTISDWITNSHPLYFQLDYFSSFLPATKPRPAKADNTAPLTRLQEVNSPV